MKAVVAAFNQERVLVGAFSVITNLRMELFQALVPTLDPVTVGRCESGVWLGKFLPCSPGGNTLEEITGSTQEEIFLNRV